MTGFAHGRRARALALSLVTTALVLILALAEWLIERFVAQQWRTAGTAIEIAVVLVAALVFRPIHQRVEAALEAAIYRRRRQALEQVEQFRHELTSFDDLSQLLQRVIASVDEHFETGATAIYLRRNGFHAEASSFNVPGEVLTDDDPLVARFHSSAAPARQQPLKSAALGTHAFAMTTAGELTGFIAVQCTETDFDAEEVHALTALARDLAVAAASLDPQLRPQKRTGPNNLPADLPALIGRENDLAELRTALAEAHFVTLTGTGGVGKTSLALQCAVSVLPRYRDGAWMVDLATINDERAVAAVILSALDVATGSESGDERRLVEYLKPRELLLLLDNCEQIVRGVCSVVSAIRASCPGVAILATSREVLHLPGEHVMRLASLQPEAAIELFAERAADAGAAFDLLSNKTIVRQICERLDGIPLAIELAAARVRVLGVGDIAQRLGERFRLLSGGAATAMPRQQTLSALIEWSYDLLSPDEQSLFRRMSVFRGSFSLPAAVAVCSAAGSCDEYHVLDVLTSLADKSLLNVSIGAATRYRFLESIREFARQKAAASSETTPVSLQHAEYFAALAAQAYREFDSKLPPGWLERLEPDIDNFRAALEWTLDDHNDESLGAQIAADCGPVFLRMELLGEGLRWCEKARSIADLPAATLGQIEYVSSMLHNNLAQEQAALACAERAVDYYAQTSDRRALVRVLSQMAQLNSRLGRYEAAKAPAAAAIREARMLGNNELLVSVLRRCAFALPESARDEARSYFSEALELARDGQNRDEQARILHWWAYRESAWGNLERAMDLAMMGLQYADRDTRMHLENQLSTYVLALGQIDKLAAHAWPALDLAREAQHKTLFTLALAFCAPLSADAERAAMLLGHAKAGLARLSFEPQQDDRQALRAAENIISAKLPNGNFEALLQRGAQLDDDEALAVLAETQHAGG